MKWQLLTVKTVLAIYIVIFGMLGLMILELPTTTQNSIVNLMIMVVSFYFGSSAGSVAKDKTIQDAQANHREINK